MYQWSLEYFTTLFVRRLERATKSSNLEARLQILISDVTINIFKSIGYGLFSNHKLFFAFSIATKIEQEEGRISTTESEFFIRTPVMPPNYDVKLGPLSEQETFFLHTLASQNQPLEQLIQLVNKDGTCLNAFLHSQDPFTQTLPCQLSAWTKLLLVRVH